MITAAYQTLLQDQKLVEDPHQEIVVQALQDLHDELCCKDFDNSTFMQQITAIFSRKSSGDVIQGLYIWGGIGRGKTFSMDLFFSNLHIQEKLRLHFHHFMKQAQQMLKKYRSEENPLALVAKEFANKAKVLCFDEFFVNDIGDAMIMAGLLNGLFENNVVLIATSNTKPSSLYKNGLQRERFLPAIDLLHKHTKVIELGGETDHRFEFLQSRDVYNSPVNASSHDWLEHNFLNLVAKKSEDAWGKIKISGRNIQAIRHSEKIAWFDFEALCDGPRSVLDYIDLANKFNTVLLSHVPIFSNKDDQARRFMNLVDEFYDRNVKLILSAQASPTKLYRGSRLKNEFKRTASRLIEMQSHEYLEKQHRPE